MKNYTTREVLDLPEPFHGLRVVATSMITDLHEHAQVTLEDTHGNKIKMIAIATLDIK